MQYCPPVTKSCLLAVCLYIRSTYISGWCFLYNVHIYSYVYVLFLFFSSPTNLKFFCRLAVPWPGCYSILFLVGWIQGFCLEKYQNSGCYYRPNLRNVFWLCYPSKVHERSYLFSFLRLFKISACTAYCLSFTVRVRNSTDDDPCLHDLILDF